MTSNKRTRVFIRLGMATGFAVAAVSTGGVALAQSSSDAIAARTLFSEARKLAGGGHYDQACPKFEESRRLENGIGTRFNLADCWEHIGRTASAWALYLDVAASARETGQVDREKMARTRANALEPRLPRLEIRVESPAEGLTVQRGGAPVGRALWGTPNPVDPGPYVIEARAPEKKAWTTTITIAPEPRTTTVIVPPLEKEAPQAKASTASPPASSVQGATNAEARGGNKGALNDTATEPRDVSSRGLSTQRTVGWVVAGAGVAGLVAGGVFAALTKSADDKAKGLCTDGPSGDTCRDSAEESAYLSATSLAKTRATFAYAGFIGGGAALAVGSILLLTAGSGDATRSSGARKTTLVPLFASGGMGIGVEGSW